MLSLDTLVSLSYCLCPLDLLFVHYCLKVYIRKHIISEKLDIYFIKLETHALLYRFIPTITVIEISFPSFQLLNSKLSCSSFLSKWTLDVYEISSEILVVHIDAF